MSLEFKDFDKKLLRILLIIFGIILLIHSGFQLLRYFTDYGQLWGFIDRFDMDNETSVPTFLASSLLFLAAILSALIWQFHKKTKKSWARHWLILALIFTYIAIDEGSALHESFIAPLGDLLGRDNLPVIFTFTWVVLAIPLVIIFLLAYAKFFRALPQPTKKRVVFGIALFIFGGLGVEMINGVILNLGHHGLYIIGTTIEESCEKLGIIIVNYGLAGYIATHIKTINLRIS